jgi:conjugal transfer ATP-binding protein TraC
MLDSALSRKLDLWGFESGVMVFRDQTLGAAFKLSPLDIEVATDDQVNSIKSNIKSFLNGLPSGLTFQIIQEVVSGNEAIINAHERTLAENSSALTIELTAERVKKFKELDQAGLLPKRNLYLFLRKPMSTNRNREGLGAFFKGPSSLNEKLLEQEISLFERMAINVEQGLSDLGIAAKRLSDDEILRISYNQWNPDRPIKVQVNSSQDVRDEIALTDCVVGLDHFVIGKFYHKVISLKMLPETSFSAMATMLSDLPFDSRLHLTSEVLDQEKEKASLQTQRRLAYASTVGKKGVSDLDSRAKLQDIEALLEHMIQGSERVFRFSLQILLRSTSENDLEIQVADTLALLRTLSGAEGMVETVAAFDIFTEFAVPQVKLRERGIKLNTSVLADFLPLYGSWPGHEVPQVLLRSRSGGIVGFDPFSPSLGNSNQLVSGGSGIGKSFLTNVLLAQTLKMKPKIFILDIGGSYKRFCETLGGQYIRLGINSGLSINPLDTEGIDSADREALDQKIKLVSSLVEIMSKEGDKPLGRLEKAEIEKSVQSLIKTGTQNKLSDLRELLVNHSESEIRRIGKILSLWCGDSPFGKFVDRHSTVSLKSDIVCFDLKDLENYPDLQSVCLFLITDLIWREVQKDRTIFKFVIFDECWRLLESEEGAAFIGPVFRTFRKYRASAVAISQTISDFAESKIASAVMPNSSIKWILRQKGADPASLKNALQLNEREMDLISSLTAEKGSFSESFLMAENQKLVVRIESTPLEYWLATTDPSDLVLINKLKDKIPDADELSIMKILSLSHPRGALGSKGS